MLANLNFSDFTTVLDGGVPPGTSLAVGTTSGKVIALPGTGVRKLRFALQHVIGTAAGTLSMYLQTASVSSGPFTSIASTLASVSVSIASSTSRYETVVDTRGESLQAAYVQAVVVVAGAAMPACLEVLGYNVRDEPGNANNAATVVFTETDAM